MEKFVIEGGVPLSGTVVPAGNKNAALREGAELLEVDFDEHVTFVVAALEPHAAELGLAGSDGAPPS